MKLSLTRIWITLLISLSLIIMPMILQGCGDGSAGNYRQEKIFQQYRVEFDEVKDELTVTATFRKEGIEGAVLHLESPSSVRFNGHAMQQLREGLPYTFTQTGFPEDGMIFKWTDANDKTYTNQFSMQRISAENLPTGISRDNDLRVQWEGEPLDPSKEELAKLEVTSNMNSQVNSTTSRSGQELVIDDKEMKYLMPGDGSLSVERVSTQSLQEKTMAGGECVVVSKFGRENITIE